MSQLNNEELDREFRSIISHAFLGDEHASEISKENFDLAIDGCVKFFIKNIEDIPEVAICKCNKPEIITTVHPLPDICLYCLKAITP